MQIGDLRNQKSPFFTIFPNTYIQGKLPCIFLFLEIKEKSVVIEIRPIRGVFMI